MSVTKEFLESVFQTHRDEVYLIFRNYLALNKHILDKNDIHDGYEKYLKATKDENLAKDPLVAQVFRFSQQAVVSAPFIYFAMRNRVGSWKFFKVHAEDMLFRKITVSAYLAQAERVATRDRPDVGCPTAQTPREVTPLAETAQDPRALMRRLSSRLSEANAEALRHELGAGGRRMSVGGTSAPVPVVGSEWTLEVDLSPFERGFPMMQEPRAIGQGLEYMSRHLSGRLFEDSGKGLGKLFAFLSGIEVQGKPLMLNRIVRNLDELTEALREADDYLENTPKETAWEELQHDLTRMGFEPGWGCTAGQVRHTMHLLADILQSPSAANLERFLVKVPMTFNIAIISPHGYFGQSSVLGMPDTGGQVVYILNQVRSMEKSMRAFCAEQGVGFIKPRIVVLTRLIPEAAGTTCNVPLEPIVGCEHSVILRVPFRDLTSGELLPHWISRFEVWPYLENFTWEAEAALLKEFGGAKPDFVIGNYSDGNLVASLLAQRMGVTQCNIAHALEKTKYTGSDLHWREFEQQYHFSCQITADLISMNTADFIITSTYQEIAGTRDSVGQYESFQHFTLPTLYRVVAGINVFDPKFNIVSPGADADAFFPYDERHRRSSQMCGILGELLHEPGRENTRGQLAARDNPIILLMSRLDKIKNVTGFLQMYCDSPELQSLANVWVIGGNTDPDKSSDMEERGQILRLHEMMDKYELDARVRWCGLQSDKNIVGGLYRTVADLRGVFMQPALFEGFGLTVVEAMACGLPTFATKYGGPVEIIEDGVSGYHVDPYRADATVGKLVQFFTRCKEEPSAWDAMSKASVARVEERYTWKQYADRLLSLSRVYSFWKFVTNIERQETKRYLEMFYGLMFRPLAKEMIFGEVEFNKGMLATGDRTPLMMP
eukprot:jgi/Mesvir1/18536/Mv11541-RA.1